MARLASLREAVRDLVRDGDVVALEGFTHLIPHAAGHELIRRQKADRKGNVLLWGILGVQKEAVLGARRAIVTVEEIVDDLEAWPNACVLPSWVISAVCHVPGGAHPSYAEGYSERDNRFYLDWDRISRSRE